MADLLARFLPRFAALAAERTARALEAAATGDVRTAASVARDMHSIAGEAGMLGLADVLRAARDAEDIAKRFSSDAALGQALAEAVRELVAAVTASVNR